MRQSRFAFYDHPFFSKYPAITENHYGSGMLTYEGTVLSDALQLKVVERVLAQAGLTGPDQKPPASVRVKHGVDRAGKAIHYFLNYSDKEQRFPYAYRDGTELISSRAQKAQAMLTLSPWGVAIVEE